MCRNKARGGLRFRRVSRYDVFHNGTVGRSRKREETIGDEPQIVASGGRPLHARRRREGTAAATAVVALGGAEYCNGRARGHARTHTTRLGPVATAAAVVGNNNISYAMFLLFYDDVTTFL